ncbi:MAG: TonB-dependent receptor [Caulobacteraceae bacterium]
MAVDLPPPLVEAIVVQSARLPPSVSDAAFSIVQVNPSEGANGPRLDEALSSVPGVSLFRRTSSLGANPTTQGVSLRGIAGSGAGRALVTLDGVPQNDPFGGWVIWSALTPEAVSTAQIVRGAGSGPYGAGALTGVVALQEAPAYGFAGEVSAGGLRQGRASGAGGVQNGRFGLFLSASGSTSDGWTPVRTSGPADTNLALDTRSAAARLDVDLGQANATLRVSGFDEKRSAGLIGANSKASGHAASLTVAAQPAPLGWRIQGWVNKSDLANSSVAVSADRKTTTPANSQYATPATGWGFNAAVRHADAGLSLEAGVDVRGSKGESRESFTFTAGRFVSDRRAGGNALVAGGYAEVAWTNSPWLVAGGVRLDRWSNYNSHRVQRTIATGAVTLTEEAPDRSGWVPTGRLGIRRDLSENFYLKTAAYAGFRPASLNELHRPFRVGNDVTEANPSLKPERLYGVEGGFGGQQAGFTWGATLFFNRLDDAIGNVTLTGVGAIPLQGFANLTSTVPAGGSLRQRRNAGRVDAYGVEAEASHKLGETLSLRTAVAYTHAKVDGRSAAPQLTGLRPAQTPRLTATAGMEWRPVNYISLSADARYESARFDDDINTRRLKAGGNLDVRAAWRVTGNAEVFAAVENVTQSALQTGRTADGVISYSAPRVGRIGLTLRR